MINRLFFLPVAMLAVAACSSSATGPTAVVPGVWREATIQDRPFRYTEADAAVASEIGTYVHEGEVTATSFLGLEYNRPFLVTIHPTRESLDVQWRAGFSLPNFVSECWMIAGGWRT